MKKMSNTYVPMRDGVRLEVSSSKFPRYSRNLNTGLGCGQTAEVATARQTVHHGPGRESWLELPVVPIP